MLKLVKGINFYNILCLAFAELYFIIFLFIQKGNLLLISFFTAGTAINLVYIVCKMCSCFGIPIRNSHHLMTIFSANALLYDIAVFIGFKAPIVTALYGNAQKFDEYSYLRIMLGLLKTRSASKT